MAAVAQVRVQDHCFLIGDAGNAAPPSEEVLDWSSGIAGTMPTAMLLDAGINSGTVSVTATVSADRAPLEAAQAWAATAEWDDIAEVSVYAPHGALRIGQLTYPPGTERLGLPLLSPDGAGHYRLRLHVSGRDQEFDQTAETSRVRFHIIAWPSSPSETLIIKATSMCGYGLRLNHSERPSHSEPPPAPPEKVEQEGRDAVLRQALQSARIRPA